MSKVLDSEVPLDLGSLFRALMDGRLAGVMRYVQRAELGWPKAITAAEYARYQQWHVPCALNFESTGKSWRGGRAAGLAEGTNARTGARQVGHPDGRPVLFSADEAVPTALLPELGDYIAGANAASGGRLQGFYGDVEAIEYLLNHGLISIGWETNARSWPGDGIDDPRASIVQRTSHSFAEFPWNLYDESDVLRADWGQWPLPAAPKPPPAPAPIPIGAHVKYSPHLAIAHPLVASLDCPTGGSWAIAEDGGIITFGEAPFHGAFVGLLIPGDHWDDLRAPVPSDVAHVGPNCSYVAVAQPSGHLYGH